MQSLAVVVLAAGQGKRMKSDKPKVLHEVAGRPLLRFPLDLAWRLKCQRTVVVVGHCREQVMEAATGLPGGENVEFAFQDEQRGTGHAVLQALSLLKGVKGPVLILSGDVPLLEKKSISALTRAYRRAGGPVAFLSFVPKDPSGYGRVIRSGRDVVAIRESRDCSREEKKIAEVNAGIYLIDAAFLRRAVKSLRSNNDQGEMYLTDLVEMAAGKGKKTAVVEAGEQEVSGVNDRIDLSKIESIIYARINESLMKNGVTIHDPMSVRVDMGIAIGKDTEIHPGVQIRGSSRVAQGCIIETGVLVVDSILSKGAVIRAYSVLEKASVGENAQVGPMGRLRPGAVLEKDSKVGNFVELKNTVLGEGSKANHLAYLGDGEIGKGVNVGAGTIFCNYDGFMKHKTVLCDGVFIGSDSQLVAPVTVGEGAYVASGSTVTRDVPPDALAIARAKQLNKKKLAAMLRKTLRARKKKMLEKKSAETEK